MKEVLTENFKLVFKKDTLEIYSKQKDKFGNNYYSCDLIEAYSCSYYARLMKELLYAYAG